MREPTFWILTALANAPQHGYALINSVDSLSAGAVQLKVPTLYAALERLTAEGLVKVDREDVVDGRFRRYFAITDAGTQALTDEVSRLRESVNRASKQLGLGGHPAGSAT
jgi:PadR family transcriptional regulator PadR